jgi:hypothetical protein
MVRNMTAPSVPRWCPRCAGPVDWWSDVASVKLPSGWAAGLVRCLHCDWALARAVMRGRGRGGRSVGYGYWQRRGERWEPATPGDREQQGEA